VDEDTIGAAELSVVLRRLAGGDSVGGERAINQILVLRCQDIEHNEMRQDIE